MTQQRLPRLLSPRLTTVLTLAALLLVSACSSGSNGTTPGAAGSAGAPGASAGAPSGSPAGSIAGQKPIPAESNPPGDIPDNLAYVPYTNPAGHYTFTHPEGWAETTTVAVAVFTDKLNGVQVMPGTATQAPTTASATAVDLPQLAASQAAFEPRGVAAVTTPAGSGVRIVYRRNSAPDPVTGRQYRDEVERYQLFGAGREIVIELYGPVGSDNVDAYRTMVQSLRMS